MSTRILNSPTHGMKCEDTSFARIIFYVGWKYAAFICAEDVVWRYLVWAENIFYDMKRKNASFLLTSFFIPYGLNRERIPFVFTPFFFLFFFSAGRRVSDLRMKMFDLCWEMTWLGHSIHADFGFLWGLKRDLICADSIFMWERFTCAEGWNVRIFFSIRADFIFFY